jgi:hypothetical protein
MPSLTGTTHSGAILLQNNGRKVLTFQYRELLAWQTDTAQCSLCIMTDWYTSIQSAYYDRLIKPQYSLCIMTDCYTSIQSVYYDRLIQLNTVCVMAQWHSSIQSVLWHTDTRPSTERYSFRPTHLCCHFAVHFAPNPRYIYILVLPLLACHTVCSMLFADGISSIATVSVLHHKFVLQLLDVFRHYPVFLTTNVVYVY